MLKPLYLLLVCNTFCPNHADDTKYVTGIYICNEDEYNDTRIYVCNEDEYNDTCGNRYDGIHAHEPLLQRPMSISDLEKTITEKTKPHTSCVSDKTNMIQEILNQIPSFSKDIDAKYNAQILHKSIKLLSLYSNQVLTACKDKAYPLFVYHPLLDTVEKLFRNFHLKELAKRLIVPCYVNLDDNGEIQYTTLVMDIQSLFHHMQRIRACSKTSHNINEDLQQIFYTPMLFCKDISDKEMSSWKAKTVITNNMPDFLRLTTLYMRQQLSFMCDTGIMPEYLQACYNLHYKLIRISAGILYEYDQIFFIKREEFIPDWDVKQSFAKSHYKSADDIRCFMSYNTDYYRNISSFEITSDADKIIFHTFDTSQETLTVILGKQKGFLPTFIPELGKYTPILPWIRDIDLHENMGNELINSISFIAKKAMLDRLHTMTFQNTNTAADDETAS